jgi:hypothetical protein
MPTIREAFMIGVTAFVLAAFGAGIAYAGWLTLWVPGHPNPAAMPPIVTYFVTAVNGTLAANLGAVLGIGLSLRAWHGPMAPAQKMQWIAAAWYVAMMMLAIALWGMARFTEDPLRVAGLLPELTKNAIGIFIAILAAALGVRTLAARPGNR